MYRDNICGGEYTMQKIAIDEKLSPIEDFLKRKGYDTQCINMNSENVKNQNYDAFIVSGGDENILGIQDTVSKAPVINAAGLTPEQIDQKIKQKLS